MPEYEMPVEEQLKILVRKFAAFEVTLEKRFDGVDKRLDRIDGRLDNIDGRLDRVDGRLDKVESRLDGIDSRLDGIDSRLDGIDSRLDGVDSRLDRIEIRLDDTHAIAKMGLEAVDALRDSTNQKFAAAEKRQKEQTELIKTVIVHVRKRVEVVERRRR